MSLIRDCSPPLSGPKGLTFICWGWQINVDGIPSPARSIAPRKNGLNFVFDAPRYINSFATKLQVKTMGVRPNNNIEKAQAGWRHRRELDFVHTYSSRAAPFVSCSSVFFLSECFWVVNVEARVTHCRIARIIIIINHLSLALEPRNLLVSGCYTGQAEVVHIRDAVRSQQQLDTAFHASWSGRLSRALAATNFSRPW